MRCITKEPDAATPGNKCPCRTMPQPAHQKDDHGVEIADAILATWIAAQRDVEIIAEPGGE